MKKIMACFICFLVVVMLFASCANKEIENADAPYFESEQEEQNEQEINEFYDIMSNTTKRPIAVMIDNDSDYKGPHAGLENAYLIYEIYVEGGSTRMMALFNGDFFDIKGIDKAQKIGPVRSSRHYFLDFALENDAIYAHCGWSPKAMSEISSRGVNNINGLYESKPFFRYSEYNNSWHNLYTSYELLDEVSDDKNYRRESKSSLNYLTEIKTPSEGNDVFNISIPYLAYKVSYSYDEENMVYIRYKKDDIHKMQSGTALSATNLLILRMDNVDLNDGENKGRQDLYDTGEGKGIYITCGKAQNIIWKKDNRSAKTRYYYEDGQELSLNPGVTFVQIVPNSMEVTFS